MMRIFYLFAAVFFMGFSGLPTFGKTTPEITDISGSELMSLIKKSQAELVIVNMWASWCEPCREEFPDLVRFRNTHLGKGIEFLFVSIDTRSEIGDVEKFLTENKVDFPTYIKKGTDRGFIESVSKSWRGALPTTFIFNVQGKILEQYNGEVSFQELERRVATLRSHKK
jgi:thiol-disulfide isomerase/thioredoxin